MSRSEPLFNAPRSVVVLLAVLVGIHMGRDLLLSPESDDWLILALAFIPARMGTAGAQLPGHPWAESVSFVSHMFLHGNAVHLIVNSAWLLAVGSVAARRLGPLRFAALFLLSGVAGAVLFWLCNYGKLAPMIGASGAISGLMAALFPLLFAAAGRRSRWLLREHPEHLPRLTFVQTMTSSRPATAILAWVVVNFVVAFGLGSLASDGGIAWEAHLGGFIAGLLAFFLLDPGPSLANTGHPDAFETGEPEDAGGAGP